MVVALIGQSAHLNADRGRWVLAFGRVPAICSTKVYAAAADPAADSG
jgi:hypothetical protein